MKQDNKKYIVLTIIGIILTIWLALLIAPLIEEGIIKIINELPSVLSMPFKINIVKNSTKTVLIFLLFYFLSIGVYLTTRKNYKKGKEYGSAKWGNIYQINKKYKELPKSENRILTQDVRLGLNAKKHKRNLNTLVIGRKSVQAKPYFMQNLIYCKHLIILI